MESQNITLNLEREVRILNGDERVLIYLAFVSFTDCVCDIAPVYNPSGT